jgi:hypothetical protein
MKNASRFAGICVTTLTLLGITSGTWAHHSAAQWDLSKRIEVSGVVKVVKFRNPHGHLELEVTGKKGKQEVWGVETSAINLLVRRGWKISQVKVGDKVTVKGHPHKSEAQQIYMREIKLPDGRSFGDPTGQDKALD